jgi:hypothetical protein
MSDAANKLALAIHDCLGTCYASPDALAACFQFLDALRQDSTWQQQEVEQVEKAVLRSLSAVIMGQDSRHVEDWRKNRLGDMREMSASVHAHN